MPALDKQAEKWYNKKIEVLEKIRKEFVCMSNATLVILAGGLGSRFGGNKQISGVGPNGEFLMEYSIFDAISAGFDHIVFILKAEMVKDVQAKFAGKYPGVRLDYAVQDYGTIPPFYQIPADRQKPFGTVHAVLAAKEYLDSPFATVNADDYYGKEAYRILVRMLGCLTGAGDGAMVPYVLGNTMSTHGGVTRGVCKIENGTLQTVVETKNIHYTTSGSIDSDSGALEGNEVVSMNIWGFHQAFVPMMQAYFEDFLKSLVPGELKAECLLPVMVDDLLKQGRLTVKAEASPDRWFGLTYQEDRAAVMEELARLHQSGAYPETLG